MDELQPQETAVFPNLAVAEPETVGQRANVMAARQAFADYLSRKAAHTLKTQAAALDKLGMYLAEVGWGVEGQGSGSIVGSGGWGVREQGSRGAGEQGGGSIVGSERVGEQEGRAVVGVVGVMLQTEPEAWRGITWGLVEGFKRWLLGQGFSIASVNNRLSVVKTYARLASQAGVIATADLQLIQTVAGYSSQEGKRLDERRLVARVGEKKPTHVSLTPEQVRQLKQQPATDTGKRDRLLLCLLFDHGFRCGEVAGLELAGLELEVGLLHFYRPKVDRVQTHRLTADTLQAALAYVAVRPAGVNGRLPNDRLLVGSRKGGRLVAWPLSERAITKRVKELGERLGIMGLSAHDGRHYWATDAARNGTDAFRLRDAGGWSSLAMPSRYVEAAQVANEGVKLSG